MVGQLASRGTCRGIPLLLILLTAPATSCRSCHKAQVRSERPTLVLQLGHYAEVGAVAFSPDGQLVATGSNDWSVKIWSAATGQLLATVPAHASPVKALAFSPDSKSLASGAEDGSAKLWSAETGVLIRAYSGAAPGVAALAFDRGGETLIAGDGLGFARVWSVASGKLLQAHLGGARNGAVAVSADGSTFALAGSSITLLSLPTHRLLAQLTESSMAPATCLALSADGALLLSAHRDGSVRLWSVKAARMIRALAPFGQTVTAAAISPDGKLVALGSSAKVVELRSVSDGNVVRAYSRHRGSVLAVAFSPDGETIVSGGADATVRTWSLKANDVVRNVYAASRPLNAALSPDGKLVALALQDGTVRIWSLAENKLTRTLQGHKSYVTAIAFSPDGDTVASGSLDKTIRLWSVRTGKASATLEVKPEVGGTSSGIRTLVFSPEGSVLASMSYFSSAALLWSPKNGSLLQRLDHPRFVEALAISPGGKMVASADSNEIRLWSAEQGQLIRTLAGHAGRVYTLAFSEDGKLLASGSGEIAPAEGKEQTEPADENAVILWSAEDGRVVRRLTGHDGRVNGVVFSPDQKTLVASTLRGSASFWSVSDGRALQSRWIFQLVWAAFAPDGSLVARTLGALSRHALPSWERRGDWTFLDHGEEVVVETADGELLLTAGAGAKVAFRAGRQLVSLEEMRASQPAPRIRTISASR